MPAVTVPGAANRIATLVFDQAANAALAYQLAGKIEGNLAAGAEQAADSLSGPPPVTVGAAGLFTRSTPGVTSLPAGYRDLVVNTSAAVVFGSGDPDESILAGTANLTFFARGGSGTIVTGAGNGRINIPTGVEGPWLVALGGGDDTVADFGAGRDTISPGGGSNGVTLGGGAYQVVSTGSDTIVAGNGSTTIDASGASSGGRAMVTAGAGGLTFAGGAGAATIVAGTGGETITGGAGPLSVQGGSGANIFIAGSGAETIGAAAGTNLFRFIAGAGGGTMLVTDLTSASRIHIALSGFGPGEAAAAVAGQTVSGGSVTIWLSDGTHVTFAGIPALTAGNFT